MEDPRPTKRVRFKEVKHDLSDTYTSQCAPNANVRSTNLKRSSSILPSLQDIYKWTLTDKATAPCFIRDVLAMRERIVKAPNTRFYWLGHIPCQTVLIVGIVVGIEVSKMWTLYTIDDSTAVIECMLHHPPPFAHLDSKARWLALKSSGPHNAPPPPKLVTAIGYPVQVIGTVKEFHGERQIKVVFIKPSESTNDQWKHVRTVVELHKSKYAVPKPFQIPTDPDFQARTSLKRPRPTLEPSSPLTHSPTSVPPSLVIPGSTDPPKLLHPSLLRTADLTDKTFMSYLEHFLFNALPESPNPPTERAELTLSHLRRIPELALLASLVVVAETRRRDPASAEAEVAGTSTKAVIRPRFRPSISPRTRMKNLFQWAVLGLYKKGSVVLSDIPSPVASLPVSSVIFSSPHPSPSKSVIPEQDGHLSDPPPHEEDEVYVPVTPELLVGPMLEILRAKGITGKTAAVGAGVPHISPQNMSASSLGNRCTEACVSFTPTFLQPTLHHHHQSQMHRLHYEILLEVFGHAYAQAVDELGLSDLVALATVNKAFFDASIPTWWRKLPSAEPLLHLIPDHILHRQFNENHWSYSLYTELAPQHLTRLYLYARHIREIDASGISLSFGAAQAFKYVLRVHSESNSTNPLLPCLNRLRLRARHDTLLEHIPALLHDGLRLVELPHYATGLDSAISALLTAPSALRTLVYVDLPKNTESFEKSLHLLRSLRHLTVSLLGPTGMKAIASLPSLESLSLVVEDSLRTLPYTITSIHPIVSLEIVLQTSFILGGIDNNPFESAMCLLRALPIPCCQLTIVLPVHLGGAALAAFIASLTQDFGVSNNSTFSAMDLRRLSVDAGIHGSYNSAPLPINFLEPLYGVPLTHIDLASFSMCTLDDNTLRALSSAFPCLESLFLGTRRYWTDPPRASLSGLSTVLLNCPSLKELGLVFSCSLGALDFSFLAVNTSITTLHVGVSPPYNPNAVSAFLARSLPRLKKIRIEPGDKYIISTRNYVSADRSHRESGWRAILAKILVYK
ncbi:hypothetical protein DEU56DRAFT_947113 [Suillus clintonianus]|uniref:uncharacterized protein n=1 Tax=Suillus clintonianus TaxID=1904413 RepID=UPI001B867B46|nr:uncharacterized protein DEU56DRAFT_947113 [Suillus clintonianus]KAG2136429.1 hypothetical protein DEU56DRAFT_947113 [Suillus clintonianus]